jgi:hypothetical protein
MKIILSFALLLTASIVFRESAQAQPVSHKPHGTVSGTIFIKNISGNIGSQLECGHLSVGAFKYPAEKEKIRFTMAAPAGDIATGKCSYLLHVPADKPFTVDLLTPELFLKSCEFYIFLTSRTSAMTLADRATRVINLTIREASCTQVK